MAETESGIYFLGDARDVYEGIVNPQQLIEVWEHFVFLLDQGGVDPEIIFDVSDGLDWYKVMYGPAYTIVFQDGPDDSFVLFYIRRSGLLRLGG